MEVWVEPSRAEGEVRAPYSKSWGIRTIFYSLIAPVKLVEVPESDDVKAAINAVTALGVRREGNAFVFEGPSREGKAFVGGSATTLRMLLPVATVLGVELEVDGDESLRKRPITEFVRVAKEHGIEISSDRLPLKVRGKFEGDSVEIRGGESSQYVSGFMIAFAVRGYGRITVLPPISSKSYIMMTRDLLTSMGVRVGLSIGDKWEITVERGSPKPYEGRVRGDFALASFYAIAASITGGKARITGLYAPPRYFGDHSIVELLAFMGVTSYVDNGVWEVYGEPRGGIRANVDDAPDLAVSIATIAPFGKYVTEIEGVERLKIKESDRIATIIDTISAFGGKARYESGRLVIEPSHLRPGEVECPNDHRIAMMAGVIATKVGGRVRRAECVNKSNPDFWDDLSRMGVRLRKA
ncbi:MAG: 3-phosphoshikimate 1-carboxyvinyltransferase [Thermoprotei archaeon]